MTRGVMSASQRRWARVGPYYAMFPFDYVVQVIQKYSEPGDAVLDPFAGRFSVPAAASYMGRSSCGVEISPLGWLYGMVKQHPAQRYTDVAARLQEMNELAEQYRSEAESAEEFFSYCYSPTVLRFLMACRDRLKWGSSRVDATVMACLMIILHHGVGRGLSNQMRQAKAMSPQYSVRWWRANGMEEPPEVDPVKMLQEKIAWRYACGVFRHENSLQLLGDSCNRLQGVRVKRWAERHGGVKLLFTSPPYSNVVNYYKDQWLRLWMLGERPTPAIRRHKFQKNFSDGETYREMIETVFRNCAPLMREDGIVVVRVDTRKFTFETVRRALDDAFPEYQLIVQPKRTKGTGQARLYRAGVTEKKECDLVLARR